MLFFSVAMQQAPFTKNTLEEWLRTELSEAHTLIRSALQNLDSVGPTPVQLHQERIRICWTAQKLKTIGDLAKKKGLCSEWEFGQLQEELVRKEDSERSPSGQRPFSILLEKAFHLHSKLISSKAKVPLVEQ